jgi:PAS domain S-box-containing protein
VTSSPPEIAANSIFVSGSEMADLMRAHDWSQTPLGEPSNWSQSLKTVLSILLTSQHPIFLWWGPELIQFYNDAYRPILGTTKHPQALGQRGQECWQEIWDVIAPMIEAVMQRGEATRIQDGLLMLERNGYLEECYFNYAYSPVRNEAGAVGGIFCACDETTQRIIGERQFKTLRELAAKPLETKTVAAACQLCMKAIANNPADLPFALLYQLDELGTSARLLGTAGIDPGTSASPEWLDVAQHPWDLGRVRRTEQAVYISDLAARFGALPDSIWDIPPQSAMVLPLKQSGQQQVSGFAILAVSPRRAFDDEYRGFLAVVASQIETAIANARSHEEERQRIESLAALNRAKTEFFSNVSHEFRTPLTLMLAPLADTLDNLDGSLPPPERDRLQLVQRNGKRLLKLVNSLLDFSRLEAGRERVVAEPVDLAVYTAELASAFRSTIEQAGLTLAVECPSLPTTVWIDRQMWEKIVLNLLSNAFKFTLVGRISVRLEWCGDRVELTVADTGVGIPEGELPLLFDRFHRVENSPGRSFEGSGIGLALVRELVDLQGGTIGVTSTVGQGSRFTVTMPTGEAQLVPATDRQSTAIPLQAEAYVEEARRWLPATELKLPIIEFGVPLDRHDLSTLPQSAPVPTAPAERDTILLVDDNADMRDYLQRLLSGTYHIATAADGKAAIEAIAAMPPDLVLTDVMMPRMNGFELLGTLRSQPGTEDIPIILLSARAGEEARIEGLAAGADDYLIKPFAARELVARVESTLKLAQLRRTNRERERVLQQETDTAKANLEQIVASLRDGFATFDRQWRYTYINQRLLEILDLPRESVIGRYSWEVFPLEVGTEFYHLLARAMTEQIEVQFEFYYARVDAWVEHRVYPTTDGVAVLMADISDRKRAELLLVEQKRLLELVAAGEPLADCLAALCTSVSKLSLGVRACIPIAAGTLPRLPTVIAPEFSPSFACGWQDAPLGTGLTALPAREAFACADLAHDDCGSPAWRDFAVAEGILACHATPILSADDLLFGSLLLCFDRPRLPTEWEYRLVEFGTNIASIVFDRDRANLALRTSEAKYRVLFESMDEGLCICEMLFDDRGRPYDYRFIEVNAVFSNLTGLTGVVGRTARELLPDLEAEWFEIYGRVVQTGAPIRFENQSLVMNRWFDLNAFPTGEPGSNRFAVLFTNITDRKLAEQERERFLSVGADLQVIADRQGRFQWFSPTFQQALGRTQAEMTALAWTDLIHPDDLAGSSVEAASLFSAHITVAYESRYRHKDGSYRWFLWNARSYPAQLDPAEMVLYGAAVDITDRKQTEIALQDSEQRLRIAQLAAKIGTWDWDVATGNVIWSPEYYALYGLDPAIPASYENWLDNIIATDRQSADSAMRTALERQQTYLDFEFRIVHPTQGIRWFSSRSQIFYDDLGQPLRAIGISIDITERKQIEDALAERARELANLNTLLAQAATLLEARNQELDRFVHIVAHDLKAPLRAVANLSEWIEEDLEGSLTADTQQHMQRLRGRVRLMEATISGLLDYARADRNDATIETVSVAQLLAEVLETIAPPPTFKIDIATEMPILQTKRLLLSQVFANLIGNAFKHHDRRDGSLQISSRAIGDFYEFAIADDGPGIAPADRDKIFIIFQSANPQKNPDSSGIGLSIVKKIVETAGGKIRLKSELGKGTTFYFTWPKGA